MSSENYKHSYKKNLEISFVITLLAFIFLFYFSPYLGHNPKEKDIETPYLVLIQIPQTSQNGSKPKPEKPVIPVPSDEMEVLPDVKIESQKDGSDSTMVAEGIKVISDLPGLPKQILEVLPEKFDDKFKGEVVLNLHIGVNGSVKEDKVLSNTINCEECLQKVLRAARRSRWQPIRYKGRKVEYWIQKSYIFN